MWQSQTDDMQPVLHKRVTHDPARLAASKADDLVAFTKEASGYIAAHQSAGPNHRAAFKCPSAIFAPYRCLIE